MKSIFDFRFAIFDWGCRGRGDWMVEGKSGALRRSCCCEPGCFRTGKRAIRYRSVRREAHKRPVFRFIPGYYGLFRAIIFLRGPATWNVVNLRAEAMADKGGRRYWRDRPYLEVGHG